MQAARASRPRPPPAHGSPALRELPAARWWRVHGFDPATGRHAPNAFNATGLGNARFSPLHESGQVVPTLYAAATLEAALMETVLHDVPYPSQGHIHDLERDLRGTQHVSQIDIVQPLQLADLTKLGLQRMGQRVSQLFETDADDYPRTREWAAWLREALPQAQGLCWMSARQPEAMALMLFGDRVPRPAVKRVAGSTRPLREASVVECLLGLLDRLGCGVAPDRA